MQDVNVNGVKQIANAILSHYQQRNNVTKDRISNKMEDYKYVIQLSISNIFVTFIHQYFINTIIYSGYKAVSKGKRKIKDRWDEETWEVS